MSMMLNPRRETVKDHLTNYVVKIGPRKETMKKMIEADTDPMKEVLCLGGNMGSHSHTTNCVVKFGPRRETLMKIIEADPMKKVLCLRAAFAPTPTQHIMLSNLGQGGRP